MPGVDRECVTHHYACACREAGMAAIVKAAEKAVAAYQDGIFIEREEIIVRLDKAIVLLDEAIDGWYKERQPCPLPAN